MSIMVIFMHFIYKLDGYVRQNAFFSLLAKILKLYSITQKGHKHQTNTHTLCISRLKAEKLEQIWLTTTLVLSF